MGGLLSWQYEEPVGGGTREGSTQGYFYAGATELDPLGADVGAADPYAEDTSVGYVGSYETAGNGFDQSGGGCMWNGMPVKCELASFGARAQQLVGVGVRSQGQEGGGFGLGLSLRVWRFNVYQYRPSGEDPGAWVDPEFGEVEGINSNKLYQVGYFYAWHLSVGALGFAQPQSTGERVPLSGAYGDLFKLNRNRLLRQLEDSESACATFLKNTFDFNASRVASAVRAIIAFDAEATTITMGAAGLNPLPQPGNRQEKPDSANGR